MPSSETALLPLYSLFKQRIAPVPKHGPARTMAETIEEPLPPVSYNLLADFKSQLSRDKDAFTPASGVRLTLPKASIGQLLDTQSAPFAVMMAEHVTPIASLSKHLSRLIRRISQTSSFQRPEKWLELKRD